MCVLCVHRMLDAGCGQARMDVRGCSMLEAAVSGGGRSKVRLVGGYRRASMRWHVDVRGRGEPSDNPRFIGIRLNA